jgi:hypothetical protein
MLTRKKCYDICGAYGYEAVGLGDLDMQVRLLKKFDIHLIEESLVKFRYFSNKQNSSGDTLEYRAVSRFTFYSILWHFASIDSFSELCLIFPEAKKYDRGNETICQFALAMTALEFDLVLFAPLFAATILRDLLSDTASREKLERVYGFDRNCFEKILRKYDPLHIHWHDVLKISGLFSGGAHDCQ